MPDATALMSDREKRFLDPPGQKCLPKRSFRQLMSYSTVDSRSNTPVNVTIGAMMLKELNGMSDDDILNAMMFDIRFKVALHTTGMAEQPMSGNRIDEKAADNNVTVINTNLTGRETKDIAADFKFKKRMSSGRCLRFGMGRRSYHEIKTAQNVCKRRNDVVLSIVFIRHDQKVYLLMSEIFVLFGATRLINNELEGIP